VLVGAAQRATAGVVKRSFAMRKSRTPPWRKQSPRKKTGKASRKLTAEQKAAAKARAVKAGRRYPNLVDNMWASTRSR
jgi:hypothetical protein